MSCCHQEQPHSPGIRDSLSGLGWKGPLSLPSSSPCCGQGHLPVEIEGWMMDIRNLGADLGQKAPCHLEEKHFLSLSKVLQLKLAFSQKGGARYPVPTPLAPDTFLDLLRSEGTAGSQQGHNGTTMGS